MKYLFKFILVPIYYLISRLFKISFYALCYLICVIWHLKFNIKKMKLDEYDKFELKYIQAYYDNEYGTYFLSDLILRQRMVCYTSFYDYIKNIKTVFEPIDGKMVKIKIK